MCLFKMYSLSARGRPMCLLVAVRGLDQTESLAFDHTLLPAPPAHVVWVTVTGDLENSFRCFSTKTDPKDTGPSLFKHLHDGHRPVIRGSEKMIPCGPRKPLPAFTKSGRDSDQLWGINARQCAIPAKLAYHTRTFIVRMNCLDRQGPLFASRLPISCMFISHPRPTTLPPATLITSASGVGHLHTMAGRKSPVGPLCQAHRMSSSGFRVFGGNSDIVPPHLVLADFGGDITVVIPWFSASRPRRCAYCAFD